MVSSSRRTRSLKALGFFAVTMAMLLAPIQGVAHADGASDPSITVTVQKPGGGDTLPNADVTLYDDNGEEVGEGTTDGFGMFTFDRLSGTSYKVGVSKNGYSPWYFDDKPDLDSADAIDVTGTPTQNITAQLTASHVVAGHVTLPIGVDRDDLYMEAMTQRGGDWVQVATDNLDGDDDYALGSLPDGTYRIAITGDQSFPEVWYDGATTAYDVVDATSVTVAGANVSGKDIVANPPSVSGTVTDSNGNPIQDATVGLHDDDYNWYFVDQTDTAGKYTIYSAPGNGSELEFNAIGYDRQYFDHATDASSAQLLNLTATSHLTGKNAQLADSTETNVITGKVTGPGGLPIDGADVELYDSAGDQVDSAVTGGHGRYTLYVDDGDYKLHLAPDSDSSVGLHDQWYGGTDQASATTITVAGNTQTANFEMTGGGTISGTVTGTGGGPLAGIDVTVYQYDPDEDWWANGATARTDASGDYTVVAPAGRVRLQFSGTGVADEYYADATDLSDANDVHVTASGSVTGIDASMTTLTKVTGTVTSGGDPVAGADVSFDSDDAGYYGYTNALGKYTVWVAPGAYSSSASADGFSTALKDVTVGTTNPQTGVDFSLDAYGWVTGRVLGDGGAPVVGASVDVEPDGVDISGTTNSAGAYRIYVPARAGYNLRIDADDYVAQYYKNARTSGASVHFDVRAGAGTTLDDVTLTRTGSLSGTVTRGPGVVPGARVTVYERDRADREGWSRVDSTTTGASGGWSIGGLDPETAYRVGVEAGSQLQFAPDAANVRDASDLSITSGSTTDASVVLDAPTHLTGIVTASGSGDPVAATVTVQRKHADRFGKISWQAAGSVMTSATGSYDVVASAGTYRLKVIDTDGDLLTSWYTSDGSWSSHKQDATEIDTTTGPTTGLDVAMPAGNTISGVLTVAGAESDDAWADAYISDGNGGWKFAAEGYADDAAGHYEIIGLLPGTYRVAFGVRGASTAYFRTGGNVGEIDTAEDIVFTDLDGTRSGVDADLTPAPTHVVDGTVTDSSDTSLEDVAVEIDAKQTDGSWEYDNDTYTDSDGNFSFDEPDGDYRVSLLSDGVHAGTSRDVTVAGADQHLGQIVLDDVATHAVHGTITGASGPLSGATVSLCRSYDDDDVSDYDCDDESVSTDTDVNGGYSLDGVDGHSYVLIVSDDNGGYAASKQVVHLDGDKNVNVALQKAGSITGSVSGPGGAVNGDFEVDVYALRTYSWGTEWNSAGYDYVNAGSTYAVGGLAPGTYRVCVEYDGDESLAGECYDDIVDGDVDTATDVQVSAGHATPVDFTLERTYDLHGAVTDSVTHEKLDDISVSAYTKDGQGNWLSMNGSYTFDGNGYDMEVPAGDYALTFYDDDGDYPYTVFADPLASQLDDADLVHVGGDTTKDVALVKGGSIAGTVKWNVTSSKYNWLTTVSAVDTTTGDVAQTATVTSGDPYYALMGLAQGTYRLDFARSSSQRLSGLAVPEAQFGSGINEGAGPGGASHFDVTSGSVTTTGTDATLHNGLLLSGAITSPNDVPLAGCVVTAYTDDGNLVSRTSTYSDSSGHYDLGGLTNGSYELRIGDGDGSGGCGQGDRYLTNLDGSTGTSSAAVAVPIARSGEKEQDITYGDPVPQLQNTGLPTITGAAVPGTTLHATDGTWTPSDGLSFTYQWFDGGVVPISTSSDYQVQPGDVGKQLTVAVTASRSGYVSASATSAPVTVQGQAVNLSGTPTISGTAKVGESLTASTSSVTSDPVDADLAFQWRRNGSDITGATDPSYTLTGDDDEASITVAVIGHKSGLADSAAAVSSAVTVGKGTITHTGWAGVGGTAEVGELVTAPAFTWTPADVAVSYQWFRGNDEITGATGSTYSVTSADIGSTLKVTLTASKTHYDTVTTTSGTTDVVPTPVVPTISNVTAPTVRGTAQVGQRLTATAGTWNPSDVTVAFQWLRNGAAISRATGSSYVLTAADLGNLITVRATAAKPGMTTATADSTPALKIAAGKIAGARPQVKGKAKPGKKLKAVPGRTSPSGVKVTYEWLRNGKVIKKATKASYKLTKKDKGKKISVRVIRTMPGYTTLTLTSKKVKVKKK